MSDFDAHASTALLSAAIALFIGLVLVGGGLAKLRHREAFRGVVGSYRLLPEALSAPVALLIPPLELFLGLALQIPSFRSAAVVVAACLFALFGCAVGINILRGRTSIDCGCFQSALRQRLSWWLVLRNGALVLASLSLLPFQPVPGGTVAWVVFAVPAGVALYVLYIAAHEVASLGDSFVAAFSQRSS